MTKLNEMQNVHIALDAMRNPTKGDAPDWAELQSYREGGLSEQRRKEVLSHIANDPEVHQQWLDLSEAEHWLANPQNQTSAQASAQAASAENPESLMDRFRNWLTPGYTALAGVGAMAVAAIAIVPSLVQQTASSPESQFGLSAERYAAIAAAAPADAPRVRPTRNLGVIGPLSDEQVEKAYVLAGLRSVVQSTVKPQSAQWDLWLDNTPGEFPDCSQATNAGYCTDISQDAQLLGQWTMLTWFGCRQTDAITANDEFWQSQGTVWNGLSEKNGFNSQSAFGKELTAMGNNGNLELCNRAELIQAMARATN